MRKSHVSSIDSCICIPSDELVMSFAWGLVKYPSECHILSLASQIRNTTTATLK